MDTQKQNCKDVDAAKATKPGRRSEREVFEAWFRGADDHDPDWLALMECGKYSSEETELMWQTWLAGRASSPRRVLYREATEISWKDSSGLRHRMEIKGARALLRKFWEEFPGGWRQVDEELLDKALAEG